MYKIYEYKPVQARTSPYKPVQAGTSFATILAMC